MTAAPKIECSPEAWEARVDLACAYRAVSAMGWHNGIIYNHISSRVPGTQSHSLINPFGLLYNEITVSNLLKVDIDASAGPALLWAAVRRWMVQIDPGYRD
jgi:ribulose-5-phosphate 4-epimerase/fuculose-1-phosphate aldolase